MPILIKVVLRNFGRLFPSLYFGMLPKFTGYIVDFQKLLISFEENSGNLRPFMDMKNTVIYWENNSKLLWKFVTIRGYEEQCFFLLGRHIQNAHRFRRISGNVRPFVDMKNNVIYWEDTSLPIDFAFLVSVIGTRSVRIPFACQN